MNDNRFHIMFVCMGNICRSPLAHGIFQRLVNEAGLGHLITVESSGTVSSHIGELPDPRMREEAERHGMILDHRARQIETEDIDRYDLILGMDRTNVMHVKSLGKRGFSPRSHIKLFRTFDPEGGGEVPDPYYGGPEGFSVVYSMVERTCRRLLDVVSSTYLKKAEERNA